MRSFNLKGFPPVLSGRAKGTQQLFNAAKMIYPLTACGSCPQVPGDFSLNPGASERETQQQIGRSDNGQISKNFEKQKKTLRYTAI
jgi:hypothetical protein